MLESHCSRKHQLICFFFFFPPPVTVTKALSFSLILVLRTFFFLRKREIKFVLMVRPKWLNCTKQHCKGPWENRECIQLPVLVAILKINNPFHYLRHQRCLLKTLSFIYIFMLSWIHVEGCRVKLPAAVNLYDSVSSKMIYLLQHFINVVWIKSATWEKAVLLCWGTALLLSILEKYLL